MCISFCGLDLFSNKHQEGNLIYLKIALQKKSVSFVEHLSKQYLPVSFKVK